MKVDPDVVAPVEIPERGIVLERVGDDGLSFPNTKPEAIFDIPAPVPGTLGVVAVFVPFKLKLPRPIGEDWGGWDCWRD